MPTIITLQFLALANILYGIGRVWWGRLTLADNPWMAALPEDQDPALCKGAMPRGQSTACGQQLLPLLGTLYRGGVGGRPRQGSRRNRCKGKCQDGSWEKKPQKWYWRRTTSSQSQWKACTNLPRNVGHSLGPTRQLMPQSNDPVAHGSASAWALSTPVPLCLSSATAGSASMGKPWMPCCHSGMFSTAPRLIWANHKAYMNAFYLFLQGLVAPLLYVKVPLYPI